MFNPLLCAHSAGSVFAPLLRDWVDRVGGPSIADSGPDWKSEFQRNQGSAPRHPPSRTCSRVSTIPKYSTRVEESEHLPRCRPCSEDALDGHAHLLLLQQGQHLFCTRMSYRSRRFRSKTRRSKGAPYSARSSLGTRTSARYNPTSPSSILGGGRGRRSIGAHFSTPRQRSNRGGLGAAGISSWRAWGGPLIQASQGALDEISPRLASPSVPPSRGSYSRPFRQLYPKRARSSVARLGMLVCST